MQVVRNWPGSVYHEALVILRANNGDYRPTEEELKEDAERIRKYLAMAKNGFVLSLDYNFWAPFIKDGKLDEEAVLAAGYTQEQIPGIIEEMTDAGWLGGDTAENE